MTFSQFIALLFGSSLLEQLAAWLSLIAIAFATRENALTWPLDIISSSLYFLVFYKARLYSDAFLQSLFIVLSLYGWAIWSGGQALQAGRAGRTIRNVRPLEAALSVLFVSVYTTLSWYILSKYSDASLPLADSFCTALSMVATGFTAKKIIQNWHVWLFVNSLYVALFLYKKLFPTALLYCLLAALSVYGLRQWKARRKLSQR